MPCSDGGQSYQVQYVTKYKDTAETKRRVQVLKDRLDEVTQYLCFMVGESKLKGDFEGLPDKILKWSEEHDGIDVKRINDSIKILIRGGEKSPFIIAKKLYDKASAVHPISEYHADLFYSMAKKSMEK